MILILGSNYATNGECQSLPKLLYILQNIQFSAFGYTVTLDHEAY